MDPVQSFGTHLKLSIKDLSVFAKLLGLNPTQSPVGGSLNFDTYITRGGERLLWWTKPLPSIQSGRHLPGFLASPYDYSILSKDIGVAIRNVHKSIEALTKHVPVKSEPKISRLPVRSAHDDALQFRIKIASPKLTLPSGDIDDVFFTINASSVDALKAPWGTAFKQKATQADYIKQKQENPEQFTSSSVDFTADGLARGLVGKAFARLGNMHKHGLGGMTFNWFMGGLHDESRTFQLEFEDFKLNLPGVSSDADIGFAYALPMVKRNWPWIDGKINLNVDHWRWLGVVTESTVRATGVKLSSTLKSFLDASGKPQQYLNTQVAASRVDSTQFIVRDVAGRAESQNLHALADILALSMGNLREALQKKLVYVASPELILLDSDLHLGAGSSSGFKWSKGDFELNVIDENAKFTALMLGDISAILNGTYNFRKRVVSLKEMQFIR